MQCMVIRLFAGCKREVYLNMTIRMEKEAPGKAPVILVIEDEDDISTLLEFILKREGNRLVLARDGLEAKKLIEEMAPPGLVLVDIMLPFVNGFELIDQIRAREDWKDVPIITLSSKSHEKDIVRALENGANDYIVKPFRTGELLARVKNYLK